MSTSRKRVVACLSDGEPPKKVLEDVETIKFTIYNFKDREHKRGEMIESPIATAHGYKWALWVYPRGNGKSSNDVEFISCFLATKNDGRVGCKNSIRIGNKTYTSPIRSFCSEPESKFEGKSWGWSDFKKREIVIESCLEKDGSLVVECGIQITEESKRVWYPKKLQRQDHLVKLYDDASSGTSDVAFLVEETVYRAHKNILSLQAKKLYEIVKEWENDGPMPIDSMRGQIFKSILDFVYTAKMPEIENEGTAKELLVAADRYECVDLKLFVESFIVDKFLTAENSAALLIFADSFSCALLKEAATNMIVANTEAAKRADAWPKLEESSKLLAELLDSFARFAKPEESRSEIEQLSVTMLREELEGANLELDGSRGILIDRVKIHRETQATAKKSRKN